MKKGARVTVTGHGRTARWGNIAGTVTRRRGARIYVRWDGTSFEDEMQAAEVKEAA